MFRFQSLDDDCTLEEEDDGLVEEEDEIDQFNDDTFGAGAIDDDWQEEHKRLAELDERDGAAQPEEAEPGGAEPPSSSAGPPSLPSSLGFPRLPLTFLLEMQTSEREGGSWPTAAAPPQQQRPPGAAAPLAPSVLSYQQQQHLLHRGSAPSAQMNSHSIWDSSLGFGPVSVPPALVTHMEDSPLMSIIKEVGLPKRPLQGRTEEGWDLSERVPPPRSSSPVIGSPPVRAVPIGTPPKQPMSHALNHQIHHPTAVHVRAPVQHRYPPSLPRAPVTQHPPQHSQLPAVPRPVSPRVLSQIQRAQLLNSRGRTLIISVYFQVAGFPRGGPGPPLLPGGGFRPFFGGPPPPHGHRMGPPPPIPPVRHNTTHLHPQHRRLLTQRLQSRGGDRVRSAGDRRPRDPYSNLMSQKEKEWVTKIQMMQLQSTDPYLDDYYYQNYYEKMEKRQEKERDSSRKEHATKLITPQVAKVEHTYRPVQFAGSLGS
ncbi:hypothetical protein OJAV_G00011950 [Oryzias javanicus]|uniref:mRNA decay factor PAT1 domain-containing protein n=1 Tax=Oryzias javanicus TaxID=123683 RepID=A0A437DP43_ORYJA|nr:hypothetical protein OJAV_G00011950 [Oryzias javanicus]